MMRVSDSAEPPRREVDVLGRTVAWSGGANDS